VRIPYVLVTAALVVPASLRAARCEERTTPATRPGVLSALRTAHPRLIILDDDLARVRKLIETDAGAREIRDELQRAAETVLEEPPVVHKLIGPRLLQQSRLCLSRIYTLATIYRLTGDARFAKRAEKEMLTAAAFPDWNPSHFLDTAEMSHALGIGYDWLYNELSPESRKAIRTALVEKGLNPSLKLYREQKGWVVSRHNWNQVCNGGMAIGALAVADEEPKLAAYIVAKAAESIQLPTARLAPDGGWDEGPGYWNYAMSYTAYYLAAMQTALKTDFGLAKCPGLAETGLFRIHSIGPTGLTFNYAAAGAGAGNAPQMFFFARLFDRPVYAWHQRRMRRGASALDLLWYDTGGTDADGAALPLDARFRNVDVVFLRSGWNDASRCDGHALGARPRPRRLQSPRLLRRQAVDVLPAPDRRPEHARHQRREPGPQGESPHRRVPLVAGPFVRRRRSQRGVRKVRETRSARRIDARPQAGTRAGRDRGDRPAERRVDHAYNSPGTHRRRRCPALDQGQDAPRPGDAFGHRHMGGPRGAPAAAPKTRRRHTQSSVACAYHAAADSIRRATVPWR